MMKVWAVQSAAADFTSPLLKSSLYCFTVPATSPSSDANAGTAIRAAADFGTKSESARRPSGQGWMPDGWMVIVSMTSRQVLRPGRDGKPSVHADLSGSAGFHCNDMVVDASGRAYVGNFGFDLDAAI